MQMTSRKRFIAGAICPTCKLLDTIALCQHKSDTEYICCVHCDYHDEQRDGVLTNHQHTTTKPIKMV